MIKKQHSRENQMAETSQTSLMAAAIGQSSLGSYGVWACESDARDERTATMHWLYYLLL